MIGMQTEARDRVRDQRIDRIVELVSPAGLLGDLPLGEEREKVVVEGRDAVEKILAREDDRLLVVVGPCSVHDPDAALEYAGQARRGRGRAPRRPPDRDAGLLREAEDDDGVEGTDQRPPPRRLLRRQLRPAQGEDPAPAGARPRPPDRVRVPRPDHAAVHLRHRRLGRDRRPHDREPDPPPARVRPLDADRVQEPDRRQRPGRGRRGPRGGGPARVRRHRRQRHPGDPPHQGEPRRPCDPARRPRRAEQRPGGGRVPRSSCCEPPACRSGSSSTPPTTTAARSLPNRSSRRRRSATRSRPATARSSA